MRARYPTSARYSMLPRWRLAERPTSSSTTPAIAFAHRSSRSMPRRSLARPTSQQLPPFESPSMPCDACCPTGTVRCFSRARRRGSRDSPTRPLSQWASCAAWSRAEHGARAGATRNHVAHVVVDGTIRPVGAPDDGQDALLDPDAIAATYVHMLAQPRSVWSWEIEVRPWVKCF